MKRVLTFFLQDDRDHVRDYGLVFDVLLKFFQLLSLLISFLDGFALVLIRSIIFSSYTVPLKLANADGFF